MDREARDHVAVWIRAEQDGSPDAGDRAFADVAGGWGRVSVPDGLAARVATAALSRRSDNASRAAKPAAPPALGADLWTRWWIRAGVATSVAAAGIMLACLPGSALGALVVGSVQMVATGVDRILWAARAWVEMVGAIAGPVVDAATVLGGVLTAPAPLCVMVVNMAVAAGAMAALRRILRAG